MRFLMTFCIGIGATLAWQTYGDQAREIVAGAYPPLAWVAPRAAAAQSPATPAARPNDPQLQELSLGLAAIRQRVEQLSFQQEQMTRDLAAKVQTAQRDILDKITTVQPKPEVAAAAPRRPAPPPQTQSSQLR